MKLKYFEKAVWILTLALLLAPSTASAGICEMSDDDLRAAMVSMNEEMAAAGIEVEVAEIACFVIGNGRPPVRILQQPFRWVPGDPRRAPAGTDITFIVDDALDPVHRPSSLGFWPSPEVASGQSTWGADSCLSGVNLIQRPSPGAGPNADITLFDEGIFAPFCLLPGGDLVGFPSTTFGVPLGVFTADIIHAGWYPAGCFGPNTLAFSVSFTFTGTDINNDQYADTALNEVYYNDAFPWGVGAAALPLFDVETVALHESGHSLGVGHFGPPPAAVMNPVYAGARQSLFPIDHAGMCTVWGQWPNN